MKARLALVSLAALAWAEGASAQQPVHAAPTVLPETGGGGVAGFAAPIAPVPTDIRPDDAPDLSLGTQVTQDGTAYIIDGGTVAGGNLFHSFARFDLGQGDFARWVHSAGDPASIRNVINRVTGGDASHIFGTIDSSALPNADFFFINPAGIVLGDGAQLNVPAAAHFSTAHEVHFADGSSFTVATPGGSTFSVADPAGFGFLGGQGDIVVDRVDGRMDGNLLLAGANILVRESALSAGGLYLVAAGTGESALTLSELPAVQPGGELIITDSHLSSTGRDAEGAGVLGVGETIAITGSLVTSGYSGPEQDASGPIVFSGTAIDLVDSAIVSDPGTTGDSGRVALLAAERLGLEGSMVKATAGDGSSGEVGIVVIAAPLVELGASLVTTETDGAGDAGAIIIEARDLILDRGSMISSTAQAGSTGNAGLIAISRPDASGGTLLVTGGSSINSDTFGTGDAGGIVIETGEVVLRDGGEITTDSDPFCAATVCGLSGAPGAILITADRLTLSAMEPTGPYAGISSDNGGAKDGAEIVLNVGALLLEGFVSISSDVLSSGKGGAIVINARSVLLRGDPDSPFSRPTPFISTSTFGTGAGGSVTITATEIVSLEDGAGINSDTGDQRGDRSLDLGPAGDITISAPVITIAGNSGITSISRSSGAAGVIQLTGGRISLDGFSFIDSFTLGNGNAGIIDIRGQSLQLTGNSFLDSSTSATGDAGGIFIDLTGDLLLDGESSIRTEADRGSEGDAGFIGITALGRVTVTDGSAISSNLSSLGEAGLLGIVADEIVVTNGGTISTDAFEICEGCTESGAGGDILLQARNILVDSQGAPDGTTFISSDTFGSGQAGNVLVVATGEMVIADRAFVSSDTYGSGRAGAVGVMATTLTIDNGGIQSVAQEGSTGDAGTVAVEATDLTIRNLGMITTSTGDETQGDAGDLEIAAQRLSMDNGMIESKTGVNSTGKAGSVTLNVGSITMRNLSEITSDTTGSGDAGTVKIKASGDIIVESSVIASRATCPFDACNPVGKAGEVDIEARELRLSSPEPGFFAAVTTSTESVGAAGSVAIKADLISVGEKSFITSTTEAEGAAGTVTLNGNALLVSDGGVVATRASEGSSGNAGSVAIRMNDVTVTRAGSIDSSSRGSGDAGSVRILGAASLAVTESGRISSTATGTGAAGDVEVEARRTLLDSGGTIESNAGQDAKSAGTVTVRADSLDLAGGAAISTSTLGRGPAGRVGIEVGDLNMDGGARIASNTGGACEGPCTQTGNAGEILIGATGTLTMRGGSEISSNGISGSGNAGQVGISAGRIEISGGRISTGTSDRSTGQSGIVAIETAALLIEGQGSIETISRNSRPAGLIAIDADEIVLRGEEARIASSNESQSGGDAGSVFIETSALSLFDGAQINTSSVAGAAGDIDIAMTEGSILTLDSRGRPSRINTSSGPGTGGRILISDPYAIVSNGGEILALGERGGANVQISTQYFISSSDRTNQVAVDGNFLLEAVAYDVSAGTVNRDLSVIDASGVLRGQCAAVRQTGQVSQLVVRPFGPYGSAPIVQRPPSGPVLSMLDPASLCS